MILQWMDYLERHQRRLKEEKRNFLCVLGLNLATILCKFNSVFTGFGAICPNLLWSLFVLKAR